MIVHNGDGSCPYCGGNNLELLSVSGKPGGIVREVVQCVDCGKWHIREI